MISLMELASMPPSQRVEYATRKYMNKMKRVHEDSARAIELYSTVLSTCSDRWVDEANNIIHATVPIVVVNKSTLWRTLDANIEDPDTRDQIWRIVMQSQVISDRMRESIREGIRENQTDAASESDAASDNLSTSTL